MEQVALRFYVSEKQRHQGESVYEWLLRFAQQQGLPGGSAFRAMAGFGRHGKLHEETFFELAGELAVAVEFIADTAQAEQLIAAVSAQGLKLPYVRYAVQVGIS